MEALITLFVYGIVIYSVVKVLRKNKANSNGTSAKPTGYNLPKVNQNGNYSGNSSYSRGPRESGSMAHEHRESGVYDSYNKKNRLNNSGTMPHTHETRKYTASMSDASKLPPGYILLNGEPVRVADLEGK